MKLSGYSSAFLSATCCLLISCDTGMVYKPLGLKRSGDLWVAETASVRTELLSIVKLGGGKGIGHEIRVTNLTDVPMRIERVLFQAGDKVYESRYVGNIGAHEGRRIELYFDVPSDEIRRLEKRGSLDIIYRTQAGERTAVHIELKR